jgi:hypothetical protein
MVWLVKPVFSSGMIFTDPDPAFEVVPNPDLHIFT